MREALAITAEEGLKQQWQRHENMHHMLWDGLKSMGLKSFVENDAERLITVNTIKVDSVLNTHCDLGTLLSTVSAAVHDCYRKFSLHFPCQVFRSSCKAAHNRL